MSLTVLYQNSGHNEASYESLLYVIKFILWKNETCFRFSSSPEVFLKVRSNIWVTWLSVLICLATWKTKKYCPQMHACTKRNFSSEYRTFPSKEICTYCKQKLCIGKASITRTRNCPWNYTADAICKETQDCLIQHTMNGIAVHIPVIPFLLWCCGLSNAKRFINLITTCNSFCVQKCFRKY